MNRITQEDINKAKAYHYRLYTEGWAEGTVDTLKAMEDVSKRSIRKMQMLFETQNEQQIAKGNYPDISGVLL